MTTAVEIFCPACGHTWDADCYLHEDDVDTLLARHNALVEAVKSVLEWEYMNLVTEVHIDGDSLCRSLDALAKLVRDA